MVRGGWRGISAATQTDERRGWPGVPGPGEGWTDESSDWHSCGV